MGADTSSNKIHNNINTEYLQTEYTDKSSNQKNTNLSLSFYKSFNVKPINNRNTKNKKNNIFYRKNVVINKKKEKINFTPIINTNNSCDKNINNTTINFNYFKCISCPMCILIKINPKNNHIIIQCENGHNNEMNIDSFISIYQIFKHSCDKCKQDLSKNFFYCTKCKELICNSCIKKIHIEQSHKGHLLLNENEVNFFCDKHKKKYVNYCKNCQKNCCKKCSGEHSSHELILIKNEIRDMNYILDIEKMINKEKNIIEKIEKKYPESIFKNNEDLNLIKSFNRLVSLRKKENQLKIKILDIYKEYLHQINNDKEKIEESKNMNNSITSISSRASVGEYPSHCLLNFFFLKTVNLLENELITSISDFFEFSTDNRYYLDFISLKNFLFNYKKNIISPEKNIENFSKYYTIYNKPNYIFPLDDGNFIIAYKTKIIFYDGIYGDELLVIDEEIFDYTYKIVKLADNTLLFFGDFLNHVKIDEKGSIKVLFTGSHIEILKEVVLDENNIVFIDKVTQKLKILTNRNINWHKEDFPPYQININSDNNIQENNMNLDNSMIVDMKKGKKINEDGDTEVDLNNSFATIQNNNYTARQLFLNSIKSIHQNRSKKISDLINENTTNNIKNINNQIKTYDIISLNENNFLSLQEKSFHNKKICLRIFSYDKNNFDIKLIEMINIEEEPLKKNNVLFLINNEKKEINEYDFLIYGTNDKKYFVLYDLNKKECKSKINMVFNMYKFFGNILLYQYQNELNEYIYKDDEFIYVSKIPFNSIIYSINILNIPIIIFNIYYLIYSNRNNIIIINGK